MELVLALLPQVFAWARAAGAEQPLTSGVWKGDWSSDDKLSPMERIQLEHSDVISFHNYDSGAEFEKRIVWLAAAYRRPILCTEYMARGNGSTFQGSLPIAKKHKVAAINWGFVAGKTQTYLPWDSWQKPYVDREPAIWFHEIFKQDGTPYKQDEVDLIRSLTGPRKVRSLLPCGDASTVHLLGRIWSRCRAVRRSTQPAIIARPKEVLLLSQRERVAARVTSTEIA